MHTSWHVPDDELRRLALTLALTAVVVVLFGPAGQVMLAACAVVVAGVVVRRRRRFDSTIVNWTLGVRRGGPR